MGKLATIIDVVDGNRVLVDGPTTGVARGLVSLKRLSLTDIRIKVGRGAKSNFVKKAVEKNDVAGKWEATSWAKKRAAKKKRANLSDFERFKVMVARKEKAKLLK